MEVGLNAVSFCNEENVCVLKGVVNYATVRHAVKTEGMCDNYRGSREEAFAGTDSSLMFFLP